MSIVSWLKNEPALVTSVLGAAAAVGASFGVNFTPDQVKAAFGAVSVVVGLIVRSRVSPVVKVVAQPLPTPAVVQPSPVVDGVVMGHAGLPPARS